MTDEILTAAEVIHTDDSGELRKVEVADYTPGLLQVGDELVRRKDVYEKSVLPGDVIEINEVKYIVSEIENDSDRVGEDVKVVKTVDEAMQE